jgi:hypothetical protein
VREQRLRADAPEHLTQALLVERIGDEIHRVHRHGQRVSHIYLNPVDLSILSYGAACPLYGVTVTESLAVPIGYICTKSDLEDLRHISRRDCRPLQGPP